LVFGCGLLFQAAGCASALIPVAVSFAQSALLSVLAGALVSSE